MNQLTVSLWGDEAFASILAQKNLLDIITIAAHDTSPPLHYILLHFWIAAFGTSEIAIRSFPILLFILLSFVVYRFTKEVFGGKAARFAFVLTLLNPFLFLYVFEARMYMLLALTTVSSMWFFVTRRWFLYVVVTVASLYTHHFALFIVFVQVVYYVAANLKNVIANPLRDSFIKAFLAVCLLYIPWLPALYLQTTMVTKDFWLSRPNIYDLREFFYKFAVGIEKLPFRDILLLVSLGLLILRKWVVKRDLVFVLWLVLPAIITYVISQVSRPVFFDRYLIVSGAALPILLASQTRKIGITLIAILIFGLFSIDLHTFTHPTKQPFRDVAQFVNQNYAKNQTVINYYTNALHYFELKHYGINVKIYSPLEPLPFWVGTALIDNRDILDKLPQEKTLLVMASGDIEKIKIPRYKETNRQQFRDLYLLFFTSL